MTHAKLLLAVLAALLPAGCSMSLTARETEEAEAHRLYYLPFASGTSHRCVQTGPGPFSHEGQQRHAIDFAMARGTHVLAARGGRVVSVKEDSNIGGSSRQYARDGNYIAIDHGDGTQATYLHLQQGGALVQVGDLIHRGQTIALSGSTGWSAMPHLHIQVSARDPETGTWGSVPFAFVDVPGDGVPRFLHSYTSDNAAPPR